MPTFVAGSGTGDNYGNILLPIVDVQWFKSALFGALFELTNPDNWIEMGDIGVSFAVEEAVKMIEGYKFMNFNPFPVGVLIPYSSAVTPPGYLPCDNSEYNAVDYPELFAVIGYTYGGADGVFNTPYLQEAVLLDKGDVYEVGEYGGNSSIGLTVPQLPAHTHVDAGHSHTIPLTTTTLAFEPGEVIVTTPIPFLTANTGDTAVSLSDTGGNEQIDIRPFFMAVHYMIYAGRV